MKCCTLAPADRLSDRTRSTIDGSGKGDGGRGLKGGGIRRH